MERKKVDELVATPMSREPTEFWLATVSVCMSWPRPKPSMNMATMMNHSGESNVRKVMRKNPITIDSVPVRGNHL